MGRLNPAAVTTPANLSQPVCGDGVVDRPFETFDDGNTEDGDSCPANCRIEPCGLSTGETLTVDVDFATDPDDLPILGMTLFVRYSDGVVSIPGSASDAAVHSRVSSDLFSITPNDLNYGALLSRLVRTPSLQGAVTRLS